MQAATHRDHRRLKHSRIGRLETWGGHCLTEHTLELPGVGGWIYSRPYPPAQCGGDVYYFSSCSAEKLFRIVLADVSGHGSAFSAAAEILGRLIAEHINIRNQSAFMRDLNSEILQAHTKYATAAVLSYDQDTAELLFTNAGHPPALWFHAKSRHWDLLHEDTAYALAVEGLPLGLIPETDYSQTAVRLDSGDV